MPGIDECLMEAMSLPGARGAWLVDWTSGLALGAAGESPVGDHETTAAEAAELARAAAEYDSFASATPPPRPTVPPTAGATASTMSTTSALASAAGSATSASASATSATASATTARPTVVPPLPSRPPVGGPVVPRPSTELALRPGTEVALRERASTKGPPVEDLIVTTRGGYHVLRFVETSFDSSVFLHLWLDRDTGNLALARMRLRDLAEKLVLG
ncbi:hypothetical protein [Streptomyces sp. NPDC050848]|uniref:hypothetical protein n=1 Tax=Streptomyces sp. NPDC050848 TaxID=3155791 RepID=UPI0033D6815D